MGFWLQFCAYYKALRVSSQVLGTAHTDVKITLSHPEAWGVLPMKQPEFQYTMYYEKVCFVFPPAPKLGGIFRCHQINQQLILSAHYI